MVTFRIRLFRRIIILILEIPPIPHLEISRLKSNNAHDITTAIFRSSQIGNEG